jgi:hypothetical protein
MYLSYSNGTKRKTTLARAVRMGYSKKFTRVIERRLTASYEERGSNDGRVWIAVPQWCWVASTIEALTKSRLAVQAFIAVASAITIAVAKLVIMTA